MVMHSVIKGIKLFKVWADALIKVKVAWHQYFKCPCYWRDLIGKKCSAFHFYRAYLLLIRYKYRRYFSFHEEKLFMERNWRGLEWRELANNFSLLRSLQLRESGISWYQNIIKNYSEGRWLYTPAPHTLNIRGHHYYDQCILTSWLANQRLQITVFSTFLNRGRSREEEVLGMV